MNLTIDRSQVSSKEGRKYILGLLICIAAGYCFLAIVTHASVNPHGSRKNYCIANLKQLDSAKAQWPLDNHKPIGAWVNESELVGQTLYMKNRPTCPSGGTYVLDSIGWRPTCDKRGHILP